MKAETTAVEATHQRVAGHRRALDRLLNQMMEDRAMCDGEGIIQMAMTPTGLMVVAGVAVVLFFMARWVFAD